MKHINSILSVLVIIQLYVFMFYVPELNQGQCITFIVIIILQVCFLFVGLVKELLE